jgi:hypothetical protein
MKVHDLFEVKKLSQPGRELRFSITVGASVRVGALQQMPRRYALPFPSAADFSAGAGNGADGPSKRRPIHRATEPT